MASQFPGRPSVRNRKTHVLELEATGIPRIEQPDHDLWNS
jgi:hypothetical protein